MPRTWEELGIDVKGKTSGQGSTTCPKCSEYRKKKKAPCLSVDLDNGLYHCNHCSWSGSLKRGDDLPPQLSSLPRRYNKPTYTPPQH
jgi:twinkle protein